MSKIFARIQQNKHFKYGIPFFAFIFGGKLLLEELRSVRYDPVLNPKGNKKLSKYLYILGDIKKYCGSSKFIKFTMYYDIPKYFFG